ncbi:MAG: AAA family ATPase [Trueperaceae bacterium]|nr:AAA family ATPase [Trueperaceae bacterium]
MNTGPTLFQRPDDQPLAARMRPRTLDEYVGQDHILGPGRLLRRAIAADQLSSVILYGPPGTGKTTLARVIANTTRARFTSLNAVLGGVKDIREAVAEAQEQQRAGRRTILFVDEVHRFNKAQQDALLPWVESGTVTLIGATTENPYFEVNKALVSRSRIFQLKPLTDADLRAVAAQALADPERGYGRRAVRLDDDALEHLVAVANGDARSLLNALELAVETTEPDDDGAVRVTRAVAEESIQQRAVLYDKEGDAHFDTISAFIKSVRGSDPDAALYWLAKMVYAGEDPRFILRRLLILASEDVGLADPQALGVVAAAAQAYDYVGLPEGRYHLAQATLYLATAPKSNSTMGFFDALDAVGKEREGEVPNHLRDGNRDAEGFGHGAGYAYPHAYRDHWVAQQYLPDALQAKVFYQPSAQGAESRVRDEVARRREAQLAAMLEEESRAPVEVLTNSPTDRARDRWLQRTVSGAGARLARVRDALFDAARVQRHHLLLDVAAGSGLLVWEGVRRTPEGQVWAATGDATHAAALRQQAARLDELERPVVLEAAVDAVAAAVAARDPAARFDRVLGRGALAEAADAQALLAALAALLTPDGAILLAETDAARAQRLAALVDWTDAEALGARVRACEEALYAGAHAWDEARWRALAEAAGLTVAIQTDVVVHGDQRLPAEAVARWFGDAAAPGTYARALAGELDAQEVDEVARRYRAHFAAQVVPWRTVVSVARLERPPG